MKIFFFEINEMDSFIRLPERIFQYLKNLLFKDAEELEYYDENEGVFYSPYILNESQKNLFPKSISFKFGNKNIIIKKNQIISSDFINKSTSSFFLFMSGSSYWERHITFGKQFLKFFDFYEFDLESGDINLYLNKNEEYIFEEKEKQNVLLNSVSKIQINIIIFIFIAFIFTLVVVRQYHRNKSIESFNYYFEI